MTFDWCISFIETPPLTLPHRNNLKSFLSYVTSTHLVLILFLYSPFNVFITQRSSCFLTRAIVIIKSHSFKNSAIRIANSVYTETINYLLSISCNITLNFTVRSKWLEKLQDHILERTWFVLAWCEALTLTLILPSCIQTSRYWLTHWVGIKLTGIISNHRLAYFRRLPCKIFFH